MGACQVTCTLRSFPDLHARSQSATETSYRIVRCDRDAGPDPDDLLMTLSERNPAIVGREGDVDILVPYTHMSKKHATLQLKNMGPGSDVALVIQDHSTNGTWV